MNKWDALYNLYKKENDEQKKRNFEVFMNTVNDGLTDDLNNAWSSGDSSRYDKLLSNVKSQGIRVFRNSDGKHKLQFI